MKVNTLPFIVQRDGMKIRCTAYRRNDKVCTKQIPVIICHGFTADQRSTAPYAQRLAEHGFAAFTFDFIGGGYETQSDGTMMDMTVLTEVEDLKAVINELKTRPAIDMNKLVLMGLSQGGFVAGLTAAQLQSQVSRLIMFYPAVCIPDDARKGSMQILRFDPENVPDVLEAGRLKLSGDYARCVMHMDALSEVSKYNGSVLLVHGTGDAIVPFHYAEDLFEAFSQKEADQEIRFTAIPDAPHGFRDEYFEEACDALLEYLEA